MNGMGDYDPHALPQYPHIFFSKHIVVAPLRPGRRGEVGGRRAAPGVQGCASCRRAHPGKVTDEARSTKSRSFCARLSATMLTSRPWARRMEASSLGSFSRTPSK